MRYFSLIIIFILFALVSCGDNKNDDTMLRIGVTEGPHFEIVSYLKDVCKKENITLDIVTFNDFNLPNASLASKDIDINIYQHLPFLEEQIESRKYPLKSVADTILLPMGIYSSKIKDLSEIKDNSLVSIPDDPTNLGRALMVLEDKGLIVLDKNVSSPTKYDIVKNHKSLRIMEIEAPNLPRTIDDVDLSVINSDWVLVSKNLKVSDAIAQESASSSPYTNIMAVNTTVYAKDNKKTQLIDKFISIYHSEQTKDFIQKQFDGSIVSSW